MDIFLTATAQGIYKKMELDFVPLLQNSENIPSHFRRDNGTRRRIGLK